MYNLSTYWFIGRKCIVTAKTREKRRKGVRKWSLFFTHRDPIASKMSQHTTKHGIYKLFNCLAKLIFASFLSVSVILKASLRSTNIVFMFLTFIYLHIECKRRKLLSIVAQKSLKPVSTHHVYQVPCIRMRLRISNLSYLEYISALR